jgi:murein L,D-transpeptidase YcbB/YkuD
MDYIERHLHLADAIPDLSPDALGIVREYCSLAVKKNLCDDDEVRMNAILELAETDGLLDFWLNEADHFLAHELGLTNRESICRFENQQAHLREHLDNGKTEDTCLMLIEEIESRLKTYVQEVQQSLRKKGFNPGPIDGILGIRTETALKTFQSAHQLTPNGIADQHTLEILKLSE